MVSQVGHFLGTCDVLTVDLLHAPAKSRDQRVQRAFSAVGQGEDSQVAGGQ